MSKQSKTKKATLKKAKKLERQGKYDKALTICDNFLDNEGIDENIIQLKIDMIVQSYNNNKFIKKINQYKIELSTFLDKNEYNEFLKIYNTLDNYLELNKNKLTDDAKIKRYIGGGLIIDNLETILVLNNIINSNKDSISNVPSNKNSISNVPNDLKGFVKDIKIMSYQYLELILDNPKERIASTNFNLEKIDKKIKKLLNPNPDNLDDNNKKSNNISRNNDNSNNINTNANTNNDKNSLKLTDDTELNSEDITDKIKILQEKINDSNQNNDFEKALTLQKKLVKIAKENKIISKFQDFKQKTLYDFK